MKPRYPNISPALFSPASMVPIVCWYRLRFVSSVLSAFCNRISGVSNVSERGDCKRCDSVHQPVFLGLKEMTDPKLDIRVQAQSYPCTILALLPLVHYTAPFSAHAALQLHNMLYRIFSTHKQEVQEGSFGRGVSGCWKSPRVMRIMLDVSLEDRGGSYW